MFLNRFRQFTESVNIVKEIGSFYIALFESIENELKLVDDKDFRAKYAPPVAGYADAADGGVMTSDGVSVKASAFGRYPIIAFHRNINFKKLHLLLPVLVQCLETMQELCAGPCVANQLALVRAGVCNSFKPLFRFFSALQLRLDAPTLEDETGVDNTSFIKTWKSCADDLAWTTLHDTSLTPHSEAPSGSTSHSYSLRFGQQFDAGAKWVGNDPALLFLLFRQRMAQESKRKTRDKKSKGRRKEISYADDKRTRVALLGDRDFLGGASPDPKNAKASAPKNAPNDRQKDGFYDTVGRSGGWVHAKKELVELNTKDVWTPQTDDKTGKWRFKRSLRLPPQNIYGDIETMTADCLEAEHALCEFVKCLIEGEPHKEVVENVCSNWDEVIMFGSCVNWLGIAQEASRTCEGLSAMNKSRNNPELSKTMSVLYHILIESMGDTGAMRPSFKSDYHELCGLRDLELTVNDIPIVGRVEVIGKLNKVCLLYFPVPELVTEFWFRPQVSEMRDRILFPENLKNRSNPEVSGANAM